MTITTPAARRVFRRSLFWVGVAVIALAATLVTIGVARTAAAGDPLSATSATPSGAKALVEVLRGQGVTVTPSDSLDATRSAVSDPATTTVLVYDPVSNLDEEGLRALSRIATNVVLLDPGFDELQVFAPGVANAGGVSGTLTADCAEPAVASAGSVTGEGSGFRLVSGRGVTCLGSGDEVYSLIRVTTDQSSVTVLGTTTALDNEHIGLRGNAALALDLLGERDSLVWYLPGFGDATSDSPPTIAELTPGFVTPLALLGFAVVLAAAVWRGRRFGPLVVENLPVTVRASETMEGRARLYAASGARLHALDALRIGTVDRLARVLGLPRVATVDEVIAAAASVTGVDPATVSHILVGAEPATDADLVRLSDELLRFENHVTATLRPTGRE